MRILGKQSKCDETFGQYNLNVVRPIDRKPERCETCETFTEELYTTLNLGIILDLFNRIY